MKPQELGAALKSIAEHHAVKRSFGDSNKTPARELDYSWKGGMISLDDEGAKEITDLTKQLMHDRPQVAELCSHETVRFELVEAVKEFVYSQAPLDPSKEAERLLERFGGRLCDFVCIFLVKGGSIEGVYRLNRVTLAPTRQMIPDALASMLDPSTKFPRKVIDLAVKKAGPTPPEEYAPVFNQQWYVISKSKALDRSKGEEKALRIAEEDLGLLRLRVHRELKFEEPPSIEVIGGPIATYQNGVPMGVEAGLNRESSNEVLHLASELPEIPQILDFRIESAESDFKQIAAILAKDERTQLQERVYLAYTWLNKALKQTDPRERLLDSVIGMEALMLKPRESRDTLAERLAFCAGKDFSSRKTIYDSAKDLIRTRNRVSHEGETTVLRKQSDGATMMLGKIVEIMTERCQRETTLDEFISEVERVKFS